MTQIQKHEAYLNPRLIEDKNLQGIAIKKKKEQGRKSYPETAL